MTTKAVPLTVSILRPGLAGAMYTVIALLGGLVLGIVVGNFVFNLLPGHTFPHPSSFAVAGAAVPALMGTFIGSAVWGVLLGRLAQANQWQRMALAGGLGFAPITIGLAVVLQIIEPIALRAYGDWLSLHRLFTVLFVPTAFAIGGVSAWSIGLGLRDRALARQMLWRVGSVAALAFLVVNLVMESLGWVVGAPRAAERFTMLTVMFVGDFGAALAGGAMMGVKLASRK